MASCKSKAGVQLGLVPLKHYENLCKETMSKTVWWFVSGADEEQQTHQSNLTSFSNYLIKPRFLRSIKQVDTSVIVFGTKFSSPIGVAPMGCLGWACQDGDCAVARAAQANKVPFVVSQLSSNTTADVTKAAPDSTRWQHMQMLNPASLNLDGIREAECRGYSGIVLTIDTSEIHRWFSVEEDFNHPNTPTEALKLLANHMWHGSWHDVQWLKSQTNLPVILKGIMTPEDALLAVQYGMDGIIVSNHGGRQLDGVMSSLDALGDIVRAVDGKIPVFFDGGIRKGRDIFTALSLGAKMVFVGRPVFMALHCNGQIGVQNVLQLLKKDLEFVMKTSGHENISDITNSSTIHVSKLHTTLG